jgi:diguanylate cyclase (GGDEF)-like protein
MLLLDVDFFKRFNDGYGHPAGDACLKRLATALRDAAAEENGTAARLGGEEFAVLLPGRSTAEALRIGERLCAAVRELGIVHAFSDVAKRVTVSIGAATLAAGAATPSDGLVAQADAALYRAKSGGRDRVALAPAPDDPPLAVSFA